MAKPLITVPLVAAAKKQGVEQPEPARAITVSHVPLDHCGALLGTEAQGDRRLHRDGAGPEFDTPKVRRLVGHHLPLGPSADTAGADQILAEGFTKLA